MPTYLDIINEYAPDIRHVLLAIVAVTLEVSPEGGPHPESRGGGCNGESVGVSVRASASVSATSSLHLQSRGGGCGGESARVSVRVWVQVLGCRGMGAGEG